MVCGRVVFHSLSTCQSVLLLLEWFESGYHCCDYPMCCRFNGLELCVACKICFCANHVLMLACTVLHVAAVDQIPFCQCAVSATLGCVFYTGLGICDWGKGADTGLYGPSKSLSLQTV